jgi:regulation of enolase protein 1 (concanavalin A-like superfamily)
MLSPKDWTRFSRNVQGVVVSEVMRKSVVVVKTPPFFEPLEDRRLLSATLGLSGSMLVFNAVRNSSASPVETVTLTDTGDAPLNLGSGAVSIVNDPASSSQDSARFAVLNAASLPSSLSPGESFDLQVNFNAIAAGVNSAFLNIASNDPAQPAQQVALRGIGTAGLYGSNQPSLARILRAYEIPTIVGEGRNDANSANSTYPNPADVSSQEVTLQQLVKAGPGPVTIQPLASFDAAGNPPIRIGYYTPGNPTDRTELFHTLSSESQTVFLHPQGATGFDPGSSSFGFYFVSTFKDNGQTRIGYSKDSLNTWDSINSRKVRLFPMENPDGSIQPNTFILTTTDYNAPSGYDFTNMVAIVRNVTAPAGPPAAAIENQNAIAGSNTMIFNRIQHPNATLGDDVHDTQVFTVNNTGGSALLVNSYSLSGPWTLVNALTLAPQTFPVSIPAGGRLPLMLKFTATSEPAHAYVQTDGSYNTNGGGVYNGSITFNTNDPNTPAISTPLRGWWQDRSENAEEPSLQSNVNLIAGMGTNINPTPVATLPEGSTAKYYGEEVVSAYWTAANSAQPVYVQQIAAWHTQGNTTTTTWFAQGSNSTHTLFVTANDDGQTFFPKTKGTTTPASATFTPGGAFGFKLDGEWSDDAKNTFKSGGGHHLRFFPVRDDQGNLVPNTYVMTMDYGLASFQNFDFEDNIYIVSNMRPVTAQTTPPAPAGLTAAGVVDGVSLQWNAVSYPNLKGYNVYSSLSQSGTYTLLTPAPITQTQYVDSTAPVGTTVFYRVTAVDSTTASQSAPATASGTALPESTGLQSLDIGASLPGSTTVITPGSDFNVTAGGAGVTSRSDGFRYIYQQQTGDFDVQVQVQSITVAGNFSTAGILARSSLAANSPDVYMSASPVNYRFKHRSSAGADTTIVESGTTHYPNVWIRLSRVGNLFTGYTSTDGINWTKMSSVTQSLSGTIYLGLGVASNVANLTTTAQLRGYGNTVLSQPTTPPTPTGLSATGEVGGVALQWNAVSYPNLKGYDVYSSLSQSGTYQLLTSTPIAQTNYLDVAAPVGTTVFYRVTAVDSTTATQSAPASASGVALPEPTGLQSLDIGASLPGSTTIITPGTDFDVTAGGAGVTSRSDGFRYIYQQQTGDFDVQVQVQSITVAGNFSTAGILARSSLAANSPDVYMSASPVNFRFKHRSSAGADTAITEGGTTHYPNVWIRLSRVGNLFTGYTSTDGINWTQMSSVTQSLPSTIDLGLAVASNVANLTTTAQLRGYGNTVISQPSGLQSLDIAASLPGSTTVVTPGTDFDVTAGGPGITNSSDGFRYIYQQQTGDFDVKVQVQSITVAGNFSTAGILARASLAPTSEDVYMSASPVNYRFKHRDSDHANTTIVDGGATNYPNVWIRLSRVGNLFTGYTSTDGTHWTKFSSVTLNTMPTTIDLGLGVASNVANLTTTAQLRGYGNTNDPQQVTPPFNLQSLDIAASKPGSTTVVTPGSDFNVTAGGPGITNWSDGFRYIYQEQTGDFDVKVQVQSLTVAGNFSTAGILARASLAATSEDVYMSASPVNYRFKHRDSNHANTTIVEGGATSYPNVWVRLSRVGNLFTGYSSSDGVHWTKLSSVTLSNMPSTIFLGLGVASNVSNLTTTAQLRGYGNT